MNSQNLGSPRDLREQQRLRRKHRNRVLVVLFFLILGVVVFLESPLTRVREITVSGNTSIASSKLLKAAVVKKGMSLWQVNPKAIAASIKKNEPLVKKVAVTTKFLQGTVHLQISQKQLVAILQEKGTFYNLLADGTVYSIHKNGEGFSRPVVIPSNMKTKVKLGQPVANPNVTKLCRVLSTLQGAQIQHISQIKVDSLGTVSLYMDNGYEVNLTVQNLKQQLPNVQTAVHYFLSKHYPPGLVDMTGQPPYSYTPFAKGRKGHG
ncbi:cell division protein FtsQ/DivIB [Alicyclobacillus sp. SO9]|uniref:cell division protein FtsQ/DivIB n=1 Tax=Alicyclobacillus sp. SO9 TaxID=2665646 RepID=UPI0018E8F97F|nr:FtsQ-type POTRA domain-containing protein [Alicyclobacillus sp. SO9]QQE80707.1 FtsQ-type POTRA domain-containing protein [Alicyclobacillus sp. SO9]